MIITVMITSTIIHVSYKANNNIVTTSLWGKHLEQLQGKNTGKQRHVNNFNLNTSLGIQRRTFHIFLFRFSSQYCIVFPLKLINTYLSGEFIGKVHEIC